MTHDMLTRLLRSECRPSHTMEIKRAGKRLRDWGELHVSDTGYVYWSQGNVWFSLCRFRDNVLIACNLPAAADTLLIQTICDTLSEIWDLEVLCDCLDAGQPACIGQCPGDLHVLGRWCWYQLNPPIGSLSRLVALMQQSINPPKKGST